MTTDKIEKGLEHLLRPEAADGLPCSQDLYRYASSDMTPEEASRFRTHLKECPACRLDLEAVSGQPDTAESTRKTISRPGLLALGAALAAAAVAFALYGSLKLRDTEYPTYSPSGSLQIKGGFDLQVGVLRDGKRILAKSGDTFNEGDVLGFFYTAPTPMWPVILFADSTGKVSRIYPPDAPKELPAGVGRPIPVSAVLEKGHGCEWIVAFFAAELPDIGALRATLRDTINRRNQAGTCELGGLEFRGGTVETLILHREERGR